MDNNLKTALDRVETIYTAAKQQNDYKTALAAVKERSRLLGLYKAVASEDASSDAEAETLSVIRGYLESLQMAQKGFLLRN